MKPNIPGGYILISRRILNSYIMQKPPEYLKVWIYLLSKAHHAEGNNLKRGQGFTSIPELIRMLSYNVGYRIEKPSRKKVWGIIEWLRNPNERDNEGNTIEPMIVTMKVTHGFVYTILNYDAYQDPKNYESNNKSNNEGIAKVQRREQQGNNKYKNDNKNDNNDNKKDYSTFFEEVWSLYPNKKGKGKISDSKRKEVYKLGEEFKRCINRYIDYVEQKKRTDFPELKYQNGSTFFNSGYVDYLDRNYVEEKEISKPISKNKSSGRLDTDHDYDIDEIEKMLLQKSRGG